MKGSIKDHQGIIDNKDLEIVVWGRKVESYMMNLEEYLTYHEMMRQDRDRIQGIADDLELQGQQKTEEIYNLKATIKKMEDHQRSGKAEK